jgi:hypothetical protein
MQTKPNKISPAVFDAVAESRNWKEAVADTTVGMSIAQRMAWFRSQSSVAEIRARAKAPRRSKAQA